jgi:hypothetical protein
MEQTSIDGELLAADGAILTEWSGDIVGAAC